MQATGQSTAAKQLLVGYRPHRSDRQTRRAPPGVPRAIPPLQCPHDPRQTSFLFGDQPIWTFRFGKRDRDIFAAHTLAGINEHKDL